MQLYLGTAAHHFIQTASSSFFMQNAEKNNLTHTCYVVDWQ